PTAAPPDLHSFPTRRSSDLTLQAHHIAAGPVRNLREAFNDEHLHAREMVVPLEHPAHGPVMGARGLGMPIKFLHHPAVFDQPAPDRKSTRLNSSHVKISYAV